MRKFFFLFVIIGMNAMLLPVFPQASSDAFNKRDEAGHRQGPWRGFFESGALRYEGNFVDDRPTGVFRYFYPQGGIRAELIHEPGEESVKATYYHRNRTIMGEGFFLNKQMEGLWRFFTESGVQVSEHYYQNGLNHGIWKVLYPSGMPAELQTWHRGEMQGVFETYYRDGSVHLRAHYLQDQLNGKYEIFFPSGKPMLIGYYNDNLNDKVWTWYNQQGEIEKKIIYDMGKIIREEIFIETEDNAIPQRPGPTRNDSPWGPGGRF